LWRHVALSFPLELVVLGLGAALYARMTPLSGPRGRVIFWGYVAVLALLQVYANFGPPPASAQGMAVMALGLYLVLAMAAAWVEHTSARS